MVGTEARCAGGGVGGVGRQTHAGPIPAPHECYLTQAPFAETEGRFVGDACGVYFGLCRKGFGFKRVAAARICGSEGMTGEADRASGWRGL